MGLRMNGGVNRIKVGIIGCGQVAVNRHLPILKTLDNVDVTAVSDINGDSLNNAARRFNVRSTYTDYHQLLSREDIQVVGVLVPLELHARIGVDVLKAGKHLLLEKPMCRTLQEADLLREAAGKAGVKAMMGLNKRWHRFMRRARGVLSSGELGKVRLINLAYSSGQELDQVPAWRKSRSTGGGNLIENGVHCYDLWRFLLREEITEIYAVSGRESSDDEPAVVTAKSESGILLNTTLSDFMPGRNEMEIFGDRQVLSISQYRFEGFEFTPRGTCSGDIRNRINRLLSFFGELPSGISQYRYGGDYTESFRAMWSHFIQAIRNDSPVSCTLEDGRRALEITLAAIASADSGQPVRLPVKK